MKYKVGDKVRVRVDLEDGKRCGSLLYYDSMCLDLNDLLEVREVHNRPSAYKVEGSLYWWAEEMLESVESDKPVKVGDIIIRNDGTEYKVLEVLENTFLRSFQNDFIDPAHWCTFEQFEQFGWKVKGQEEKEKVKVTYKEVAKKFNTTEDKLVIEW